MTVKINRCQCELCQRGLDVPDTRLHHRLNLLMSRLNEQQRRWLAALEAQRRGHGGIRLVSLITGLDEKTIRRGRTELENDLRGRPVGRVRVTARNDQRG